MAIQRLKPRWHFPTLLRPQSRRHFHLRYLPTSYGSAKERTPQGTSRYSTILLLSGSRQASMPRWRRTVQRDNRRILHCEYTMYCDRVGDVLGIHQAGRYEDTGVASESVAVGWLSRRGDPGHRFEHRQLILYDYTDQEEWHASVMVSAPCANPRAFNKSLLVRSVAGSSSSPRFPLNIK